MQNFCCPSCGVPRLIETEIADQYRCGQCFTRWWVKDVFLEAFRDEDTPLIVDDAKPLDEVDQLIEQLGGSGKAVGDE